jgi:Putative zinc-finger
MIVAAGQENWRGQRPSIGPWELYGSVEHCSYRAVLFSARALLERSIAVGAEQRGRAMDRVERDACELVLRRLDDYLDRELSATEMDVVTEHLEQCLQCAMAFSREEDLLQAIRAKLRRLAVPAGLFARVSDVLDQAVRKPGSG